jgi:osmotically-inducible protein OsmY
MDDKVLRRTIIDVLDCVPGVNAARIGVAVENGVATLTGRVASSAEKAAVEQAVRRMSGICAVVPFIAVCEAGRNARDDEIARRARVVIAWHAHNPEGAVTEQAHNGWVTLTGTVEDAYERREAEAAVRTLDDVVGVTNLIGMRVDANGSDAQICLVDTLHVSDDRGSDPIRIPGQGAPEHCPRLPELSRIQLAPNTMQQIGLPHRETLNL